MKTALGVLEAHLLTQTYLVGDAVTLADIIAFCNLFMGFTIVRALPQSHTTWCLPMTKATAANLVGQEMSGRRFQESLSYKYDLHTLTPVQAGFACVLISGLGRVGEHSIRGREGAAGCSSALGQVHRGRTTC